MLRSARAGNVPCNTVLQGNATRYEPECGAMSES
jgi:hypothetical protein